MRRVPRSESPYLCGTQALPVDRNLDAVELGHQLEPKIFSG